MPSAPHRLELIVMTTRTVPRHRRAACRLRTSFAALGVAALALTGAVGAASTTAAPPAAAAQLPQCPPDGDLPPVTNLPPGFTDSAVSVWAGGDYRATGAAAESEGLLLVEGDATFDKTGGTFNVGTVGVGSGIAPAAGSLMLAVGGDLTVGGATRLDVGATLDGGGAVQVGGTSSVAGTLETNGGPVTTGMGAQAALAPHTGFRSTVEQGSAALAALPGTPVTPQRGQLELRGPGADADVDGPLVFVVEAAALAGVREITVVDVPRWTPVLVDVVGDAPVTLSPNYVAWDGERVDDGANLGNAAGALLWNVVDATSVHLGGSSQLVGSVVAPHADATVTASTNGRLYVGGDLTTSGAGNEQHAYPWTGGSFGCEVTPTTGTFSVAKQLDGDAAGLVPPSTTFPVRYTYDLGAGPVTGELVVAADGTPVTGPALPAGTVVTLEEGDLPAVPDVVWDGATFSPSPTVTVGAGTTAAVVLTNTADEPAVLVETGGVAVRKVVQGEAAGLVPAGTTFTVRYAYEGPDGPVTGELAVPADGTLVEGPQALPGGTTVTVEEVDLPDVDGVVWGEPEVGPSAEVVVVPGTVVEVTVTNTATPAPVEPIDPTPTPTDPTPTDPVPTPTDPAPTPTVPAVPAVPGDPGAGTDVTGGSDGDDGLLATTGAQVTAAVVGALLLVGGGTALVVARRRHQAG